MPSDTRTTQKGTRRSWPIALYLVILAFVMLLPMLVFAGVLLERNSDSQKSVLQTLVVSSTRSVLEGIESVVTERVTTLRVLATSESLTSGDLESFYYRTKDALAGTGSNIYILGTDLMTIMSTRQDWGAPPSTTNDPESARQAFATDAVTVSNILLGAVSKAWVFNVLLPISFNGQPYLIALNQDAASLNDTIAGNVLPDGWQIVLLDGADRIVSASPGAGNTGDLFTLIGPERLLDTAGFVSVVVGEKSYRAVIDRSPMLGWTVVAYAPAAVVDQPLFNSFITLLLGGFIILLGAVVLVFFLAREIQRAVRGLAREAKQLGAGEPVTPVDYPITEIAVISEALLDAQDKRNAVEQENRFLMRELAHRSKNQMTVIAAMAKQTAKGEKSLPSFLQSFEKRIFGLARSTDLLLSHGAAGIELDDIVNRQLETFAPPAAEGRVTVEGPRIRLSGQAAQTMGMAAHELSTNAVKYGAFSVPDGRLRVSWTIEDDKLRFVWRETVSRLRRRAERRGFGSTVLETMVASALSAETERIMHRDGIEWVFVIPLDGITPAAETAGVEK